MKKFSVLLVAILALMMLFVSCENEPKERAATKEDVEIVMGLISSIGLADEKAVDDSKYNYKEGEGTITFKEAVCKEKEDNVVAVLNGTMTTKLDKESKTSTLSVDFGDGTKYKDKDHTLVANIVMKMPEKGEETVDSCDIILDGFILTDFDFDSLS